MAQTVKDVMTADPITVEPASPVEDVARLMKERDVGAVVVEESGSLRGLVTDRDLVVRGLAEGRGAGTPVREVCSGDVTTVRAEDPLDRAVEQMRRAAVRRLPVVDGGRTVGIVSIGDIAIERDERSALADISAARPNR